jgi:serine/threonine-protein kinase RsbW
MAHEPLTACPRDAAHHELIQGALCERCVHAASEMEPLLDGLVDALSEAGFSRKEVFGVRLSLEEAIVNAIKHGHHGDPTKEVHVRCQLSPQRLVAEVEDEGAGYDPKVVLDPLAEENVGRDCGRGLLLMHHYMTWVRHNARGTCVTLCKERAG